MRRWLRQLFPIVMLAVLVQILAPIGVIRAASAALDPFNNLPICSAHAESDGNSSDNGSASHGMCCPLCAVAQAMVPPPVDPAASLVAPLSWLAFAWVVPDHEPALQRAFGHAQARAPPQLS